ncbi:MAG: 30S ribosome-binding factor RbfA [Sulfurimicrobium sp.]|jgi:ribosome-binding factor A|nr:30S ribosome-binding factor RbfA [Sulfurimicrobium sp.]MDP2963002.1 30S ribosome-binding factor RbfA [Sulfurimicrobium sp.]MDZ7654974.1 30S ribosome-binding factor RbfA [Sulfurimicrobium sp.]
MPKDHSRPRRVAEQIQRELAELIQLEVKDPRVGMVTLTDVEVTPDYSHAKVYFTLLNQGHSLDETLEGLSRAAGYLRSQLAHRMRLRIMPQLHFVFDSSVERGVQLSNLIEEAVALEGDKPSQEGS